MLSLMQWYCGPLFHLLKQEERPGIGKAKSFAQFSQCLQAPGSLLSSSVKFKVKALLTPCQLFLHCTPCSSHVDTDIIQSISRLCFEPNFNHIINACTPIEQESGSTAMCTSQPFSTLLLQGFSGLWANVRQFVEHNFMGTLSNTPGPLNKLWDFAITVLHCKCLTSCSYWYLSTVLEAIL